MSDLPELEAIEARLRAIDWMKELMRREEWSLIEQRNQLRAREAKARARDLRRARQYCGDAVEVGG